MTLEDLSDTEKRLHEMSTRVEQVLDRWLPSRQTHPTTLHEAMRYSVLNGGKRIRPALVYATGQAVGVSMSRLDGPACAVELIHAYSLIHDDLPAMDNDDLRRGKPTCHRAFDEATAILAGDAIQALAFYLLTYDDSLEVNASIRLRMVGMLANAAGSRGMAGGQAIDLDSVGKALDLTELEDMHIHKTGALIRASVSMAAIANPLISSQELDRLDRYAQCIGLAFQIKDDILDVEGDTQTLGKPQGSDSQLNKPTYPALMGLHRAKTRAMELHDVAMRSLEEFDQRANLMRQIATYIVKRVK
jgi:geranylgeranyl pyrophosphate synthase